MNTSLSRGDTQIRSNVFLFIIFFILLYFMYGMKLLNKYDLLKVKRVNQIEDTEVTM